MVNIPPQREDETASPTAPPPSPEPGKSLPITRAESSQAGNPLEATSKDDSGITEGKARYSRGGSEDLSHYDKDMGVINDGGEKAVDALGQVPDYKEMDMDR